ncbi:YajD family HNH nuclease [Motiliproteus sp. MSK22-1]|uniref:YajD family HNH nuclease n=1 Tax=Motiliproteus sp. MSK22-1 TaxID=1897630 RepID=UPI00097820DB|nr:YajD family HNH nuclease [Motiliproteus sp. MSK22-1]OMH39680.1 HNH endonuclease [Motiliproteus sp. MSK22-1]
MSTKSTGPNSDNLKKIIGQAQQSQADREAGYREKSLKMYPWVCGRCAREFTRANLSELTVHHRDHNHDNNPPDGSNWELLCLYCHDNEHSRYVDTAEYSQTVAGGDKLEAATSQPFANLKDLLKGK